MRGSSRPGAAAGRRFVALQEAWRAVAGAVRLVRQAAPREILRILALQAAVALGILATLLVGKRVLEVIVRPDAGASVGDLLPEVIALGVAVGLTGGALAAVGERQRLLAELVERHVHGRIVDAVASVGLATFEAPEFHDRLQRARIHAVEQSWQVSYAVVSMGSSALALVASAGVVAVLVPVLLPAMALAFVPLAVVAGRNSRASYAAAYEMTPAERERAYLGETLVGAREAAELRLFGADRPLRARYDQLWDRRLAQLRGLARLRTLRSVGAGFLAAAITSLGVAFLAHLALSDQIAAADAGVAAVALQQTGARLRTVNANGSTLRESTLFVQDVLGFLADPGGGAASPLVVPGTATGPVALRVEALRFSYPGTDTEVLRGVSLRVEPGELVALVGGNGSGKTTLAKLICGLYQPTAGRVAWRSVDGEEAPSDDTPAGEAAATRSDSTPRVSALLQDFVRYELSVRDNVVLGDPDRTEGAAVVRAAAVAAGVDGVIEALPGGYDTRLSRAYEGGAELSVGEWQRLALARTLYRTSGFLVLDEPSASLDPSAEEDLVRTIRQVADRRGVLLISHRLSTVRSADRIYVMEAGRIVESGSHTELLAEHGIYAHLFPAPADDRPVGGGRR